MKYRFELEKYRGRKSRYTCPECGHPGEFTRYYDNQFGTHLDPLVGKCNRIVKCGYHYPPKKFFDDHPEFFRFGSDARPVKIGHIIQQTRHFNTIDPTVVESTLTETVANNLALYIRGLFGEEAAEAVLKSYKLGTWPDGRAVFWQIDRDGLIRAGKLIEYCWATGRRSHTRSVSWVHSELQKAKEIAAYNIHISTDTFTLDQCFFGEHLLAVDKDKPVAVVESEKTALIASAHFPEWIWLASGGCGGLKIDRLTFVTTGRHVQLFPDSTQFEKWSELVRKKGVARITVSDILERSLSEEQKARDLDLADIIIEARVNAPPDEDKP
jgi:hypothetical protein